MTFDQIKVVGTVKSEGRYEVMIEETTLSDELIRTIYEKYDGPRADFGGGVTAINCGELIDYYGTDRKMARALKIKIKQAREVIAACEKIISEQEVY